MGNPCFAPQILRDKFLHRGFCTSETRIWSRILGNEFWAPEFWTRIPGSNFLSLFFPAKEAPRKIHPQEIHLSKFTFQNSTQKSGQKIHIAPLQGLLTDVLGAQNTLKALLGQNNYIHKSLSWAGISDYTKNRLTQIGEFLKGGNGRGGG